MYNVIRKGTQPVMEQRVYEGMEYLVFPELEKTGIVRHLFSTRLGGVSKGCYGESNFSYTRGDLKEAVDENYRRVAGILGHERSLDDFVSTYQTHTTNVRVVTEEDRGKGTVRERDYIDTDGLITDIPGIILVTYHADCTPLYFVDPVHRAIGLSHSGWKGTAGSMGRKTLEAMEKAFGTRPEDCICGIGPSICGDCYEIGEDVAEIFRASFAGEEISRYHILREKENGKYLLNLWQANKMILEKAGVPSGQISVTDICTCCNPKYLFSHRKAHEQRGNLAAFLTLK
ncbi:MAG: peptidoglycan editing factor PgeF [Butyrivibrio sp.]|jgi:YfiH family protein|nr:peptidoglycan editing factor PgeF [Butyrivibrio sp.]